MYAQRIQALGKDIEVDWFEVGHGALAVEQRIAHQERMVHFAQRVVNG